MPLPLTIPLDDIDFESAARRLADESGFACIDARRARKRSSRYSIVVARPVHTFSLSGGFATVDGHTTIETPYTAFSRFCARVSGYVSDPYLPFCGGIVGYVGFEGARALRGMEPARGFSRMPQVRLGIYGSAAFFDHAEGRAFIVANGSSTDETESNAAALAGRLAGEPAHFAGPKRPHAQRRELRMSPADSGFRSTLDAARSWVRAESVERIHLARQSLTPIADLAPIELFLEDKTEGAVRALFTHEGAAFVASSFEGVLEIRGKELSSSIGARSVSGSEIERELARDIEHLCIDGPVASSRSGSTGVTFTGTLRHELAAIDALVGLMPAHSMTGSPYSRAMDFISSHEGEQRALYGGAFGFMDASGLSFRTAEFVRTIADGALATTSGADITAETDSREFMEELGARLNSSLQTDPVF